VTSSPATEPAANGVENGHAHAGRAHVRVATENDLPDLLLLWPELRHSGGRQIREALYLAIDDVGERLRDSIHNPEHRVLVATCSDRICGMTILTRTSLGPLSDVTAVQLHHLVVASAHRRSGVGHALLAAAASYADEIGADHVLVGVAPGLRDTNRFYARLGFSPVLVRRMTTVTALRRRLTDSEHPVAALEELTRRRLIARPRRSRSRVGSRR
jgi:GNAT superfamily N-acetyltransferase